MGDVPCRNCTGPVFSDSSGSVSLVAQLMENSWLRSVCSGRDVAAGRMQASVPSL